MNKAKFLSELSTQLLLFLIGFEQVFANCIYAANKLTYGAGKVDTPEN